MSPIFNRTILLSKYSYFNLAKCIIHDYPFERLSLAICQDNKETIGLGRDQRIY